VADEESATDRVRRAVATAGRLSPNQHQAVHASVSRGNSGRFTLPEWVTVTTRNALDRAGIVEGWAFTDFGVLVRAVMHDGKDKVLADAERVDADMPQPAHVRELREASAAVVAANAEMEKIRLAEKELAARKAQGAKVERDALNRRSRAILACLAQEMEPDDIAAAAQMTRPAVYYWIENNRSRIPGRPKRQQES
jgi:hypothetical protein